jgi:type II secretory pathway component GspD/PulD (secretin)
MRHFFTPYKFFAALVALQLTVACAPSAFAGDPDFGSAPYPYIIKDQELGQVLTEFGINTKYKMVINAGLTQKVTGTVSTANPREFIDSLCRQYSVDWYYDGLALYFTSESDTVTRFMKLENVPYASLKKELERQGLSTSRFTIKPAQGNKLISVMGPPRFQEVVGQTLTALSTGKDTSDIKLSAKPTDAPLVIYRGKDSNVIKFGKAE